jgi:hypothetical protein
MRATRDRVAGDRARWSPLETFTSHHVGEQISWRRSSAAVRYGPSLPVYISGHWHLSNRRRQSRRRSCPLVEASRQMSIFSALAMRLTALLRTR